MKTLSSYYHLILQGLLTALGADSVSGGLEVTDNVIRLAWFDGKGWQLSVVRLEPGVLEGGRIKDRERFVEGLRALKAQVPGMDGPKKRMDVTLTLGEAAVYNQSFSLPLVEGKGLDEAIALNLQMASPAEVSQSYSGWEIVGKDEAMSRIDVLGVFADRAMVDEMIWALFEVGFVSLAVESKALALARTFREQGAGIDLHEPYFLVNIDDASLDFLIVRNGRLYFAYVTPWRDLEEEKGVISLERFKQTLAANLRQVMNFYLQHWHDKPVGIVVTGQALAPEAMTIAQEVLQLPTFSLSLDSSSSGADVPPEWFVAVGAALRMSGSSAASRKALKGTANKEATLLGEGARDTFQKDKIVRLAEFWRFATPILFAILIGLFVVTDLFLMRQQAGVPAVEAGGMDPAEQQEVIALQASAATFNRSVSLIASIEKAEQPKYPIIGDITQLASSNNVTITQVSFTGFAEPISLMGQAQSEQQILAFKTAIEADPQFGPATLPLSDIVSEGSGYSFSMTFEVASSSQ